MEMKVFIFLVLSLCAFAAEVKEKEDTQAEQNKDKRQTQSEYAPTQVNYRNARKQEATPVMESQEDENDRQISRGDSEEYRPGQVISLNVQELLDLQPERRAPLASGQQLQQLYSNPQAEHRQNLQQIYYLEPQTARQVSLQPSHAVIARPSYSSNGGEASVGAALSVSDSGVDNADAYDQELLALLGQPAAKQEDRTQAYQHQQVQASTQSVAPQYQQIATQSVAPQYQQVDRYITKPSKKSSKIQSKTHSQITPPQPSSAPQQYLIETTNVQQQAQPAQTQQYRAQPQRVAQALRYVPVPAPQTFVQQALYERPESQGLKIVAPPNLQQARAQAPIGYRIVPQYQQVASPKQYRIIEAPRPQQQRQEQRVPAPSVDRPIAYYSTRYQEPEKSRSVKIYDPISQDDPQQPAQLIGEKYYLRPVYRTNDQRALYELSLRPVEQQPAGVATNPPHSAIYVNKNVAPKKITHREQALLIDRPSNVKIEQHGQSLEEARNQLPPPRNNRAYTPEEFAALVAAGYAVTPIPVAPVGPPVPPRAQSRSGVETASLLPQRRPQYRRHQYLPLRDDDAP